jgi:hypothetical protein
MQEAYTVGSTLVLHDKVSATLDAIGRKFIATQSLVTRLQASLNKPMMLRVQDQQLAQLNTQLATTQAHLATLMNMARNPINIRTNNVTTNTSSGGTGGGAGSTMRAAHMGYVGSEMRRVGMAGFGLMGQAIGAARDWQDEVQRFKALGLGDVMNQEALKFVGAMKTYGTSMTENMRLFRDAQTVFRDSSTLEHAKMIAPVLAQMHFANTALYGEGNAAGYDKKLMDMLRVIELRKGGSNPAEFMAQANMIQQVLTTSGGRVDPTQYLNFMKTGSTAAFGMTNRSLYYQLEPLIMEMGGMRAGTGLQTAFNRLQLGIGVSHTAASEMLRLGLLDPGKIELNALGGFKRYKSGQNALVGADLMRQSPVDFFEKVILPMYKGKGITDQKDIERENALIFGRTGGAVYNSIFRQMATIRKSEALSEKAADIGGLTSLAKQSVTGQYMELHAKYQDALKEMGVTILPAVIDGMKTLTALMKELSAFAKDNPTAVKSVVYLGAAMSSVFLVGGTILMARSSVMMLGEALLGLTAAAGTAGATGVAGGAIGALGAVAILMKRIAIIGAAIEGYQLGGWLYNQMTPEMQEKGGRRLARVMSFFGNDEASQALSDMGDAGQSRSFSAVPPINRRMRPHEVHTTVLLNGKTVAKAIGTYMTDESSTSSGGSAFDPNRMPAPPALTGGR